MNFDKLPMRRFPSDGLDLAFLEAGDPDGTPVILVHGFASTAHVNWVYPGWIKSLETSGWRIAALDHRGHGESDKPHEPDAYVPDTMAGDVLNLMDHLQIEKAHLIGYSMGARISAFAALAAPDRVRSLVLGGLGSGLYDGVGDWDPIADALLADSIDDVADARGRMFRAFADQTKSDRVALAACIRTSRATLNGEQLRKLTMPALVAIGTKDEIGGSPHGLAEKLPDGRAFEIEGRDHMLAVGDKTFKAAVGAFYDEIVDKQA